MEKDLLSFLRLVLNTSGASFLMYQLIVSSVINALRLSAVTTSSSSFGLNHFSHFLVKLL